jgi:hypothetical protein
MIYKEEIHFGANADMWGSCWIEMLLIYYAAAFNL